MVINGEMGIKRELQFRALLTEVGARVISHPIIKENRYLKRFAEGVTMAQARHELQQFSVFAHNFDVAQSMLVTNAPTFDAYQKRLQVLLNEKGIPYANGFEGELTGRWKQETVHFQWLLNMAEGLGLAFAEVGKIWVALPGSKQFVEAVFRYYANVDQSVSLGAAFAVENWAANNLWLPWIAGMKKLNASLAKPINLGYLSYHEAEERHHSQSTIDELLEQFTEPWFNPERFLQGAEGILNEGVLPYYVSQLDHLPDKHDGTWPATVCEFEVESRLAAV
jgi:pyrroloquinoline quinone (PQQ) biosynthesis protein C